MGKYIEHPDKVLMIQKYVEERAKQSKVPIIENYGIDNTVSEILEILFKRVKAEFNRIRS